MNLLKGTPLLREKHGKWEVVYFISADQVSVRGLINESRGPRIEFIAIKDLVVDKRALADQTSADAKARFAKNIAGFESQVAPLSGKGAMSSGGFSRGPKQSGPITDAPISPASGEPELGPSRSWSDKTGKFKIDARLVKQADGNVLLKRADGRTVAVPVDMLSSTDQTYLKERKEKPSMDNPFDNVVDAPDICGGVDFSRLMQPITTVGDLRWGAKSVAISPDNLFLMIGRKGSAASLCDLKTGRILIDSGRMDHMGDIGVCDFTPDGRHMVMGGYKGVFEVYEVDSKGKLELKGQYPLHNKEITALDISRDGKFALSGDADKTVRYWNLETGQPITSIDGFDGKIKATRITPSGNQLLATDGKTLKAFAVDKQETVAEMQVARSPHAGQAAAISPDGSTLAVGDGYNIHLWDLVKRQQLRTMDGTEINWSMAFAPDNQHLMSGGNGVIYVWDCRRQMKLQKNVIGKSFYVQAIAVSPDGTLVTSPSDHSAVVVVQAGQ